MYRIAFFVLMLLAALSVSCEEGCEMTCREDLVCKICNDTPRCVRPYTSEEDGCGCNYAEVSGPVTCNGEYRCSALPLSCCNDEFCEAPNVCNYCGDRRVCSPQNQC